LPLNLRRQAHEGLEAGRGRKALEPRVELLEGGSWRVAALEG